MSWYSTLVAAGQAGQGRSGWDTITFTCMRVLMLGPSADLTDRSRRIIINLLTTFAAEGYNLVSSYRTSAKGQCQLDLGSRFLFHTIHPIPLVPVPLTMGLDSSKDTLSFLRGEPDPDPIFMAIAFHSSDRIWIIDAEADVGEAVEEGIRKFWDAGIRDARVRERHCREIRLKGNPCKSESGSR